MITGGSGIALGLPANYRDRGTLVETVPAELPAVNGGELVLAGSCSSATRAQIEAVRDLWPRRKLDVDAIAAGEDIVAELVDWASRQDHSTPLLIYASADPQELVRTQQRHGVDKAGVLIEKVMGDLASCLVSVGFTRLIVAGGETSGAVVSALGIRALRIGAEIDPVVPWTESVDAPRIALALKSGNFGAEDFFTRAFAMFENS